MVMLRRQTLTAGFGVLLSLGLVLEARSDTLFNGTQPVKIGHGKVAGPLINWKDCSDNNPETFDAPPYSVDLADNCDVKAFSFGLLCEGDLCTVNDEKRARKYLPDVHQGDKVSFHIENHSVELKAPNATVRLEK